MWFHPNFLLHSSSFSGATRPTTWAPLRPPPRPPPCPPRSSSATWTQSRTSSRYDTTPIVAGKFKFKLPCYNFSGGPDQSEGDQGKPEEPRGHQPETARTGEISSLDRLVTGLEIFWVGIFTRLISKFRSLVGEKFALAAENHYVFESYKLHLDICSSSVALTLRSSPKANAWPGLK